MSSSQCWATPYVERLLLGETVSFRPRGNSMMPRIKSGQLCTVEPTDGPIDTGDIVLCRVRSRCYLHMVHGTQPAKGTFLIGNNKGFLNGWIGRQHVFGKLVRVEP